ncbi:GNAT family N-acetyltransferase [Chromobacterium sp. IIBBL 290-4]|uniref:GNAT family N-acetyltransferase n=1 Tax=Chromobacterium sp. IIBBL 290-4 TaxID=2953890 RepID=UPI0020B7D832|nr:GNAT family N-acetyltransferase [Chromobacterium sp. IIBBL 290-4]UTH76220.1 GNAT family N-acetyltransferase [Chromobacterium sp. IIBBL 290-4]
MRIRQIEADDFAVLSLAMDDWWGGKPVRHLLHRMYFDHFSSTSFAAVEGDEVIGFLVGFRSQSQPEQAYIHLVGVSPQARGREVGRNLYRHFFEAVGKSGCREVRAITSPGNAASIAFHRRMGFALLPGDGVEEGVPVMYDYSGPGQHRVGFQLRLDADAYGA